MLTPGVCESKDSQTRPSFQLRYPHQFYSDSLDGVSVAHEYAVVVAKVEAVVEAVTEDARARMNNLNICSNLVLSPVHVVFLTVASGASATGPGIVSSTYWTCIFE